ncbi:hypothetical protein [Streptomyces sp. ML-6]|uniref:hypothetical protein n=1 Tax=Streptomyces sp. ML-6 TaxID=2982693 RepID=UPI0024BF8E9F|nr:hypothetical protein [Streptomyces sp. ML-6]MDK0521042.1 hypothetical protein [Streptomyces sp. ML-6]
MSAQEERGALAPRPSLYAYALRLHRGEPGGRLPARGYELPPQPEPTGQRTGWSETCEALEAVLNPWLTTPAHTAPDETASDEAHAGRGDVARAAEEIHRGLRELKARDGHVRYVVSGAAIDDEVRARALGRCLVRTGTALLPVCVGLALLARFGEPEDVSYLKVLGQLGDLADLAVLALDGIDRPVAALVWLGHYTEGPEQRRLVDALVAGDADAVLRCLVALPRDMRSNGTTPVRRVVEAVRLVDILRADRRPDDPPNAELLAWAGQLLLWTASVHDDRAEILRYPEAIGAYEAFVARAAELPPGIDHYALLLSVALELHSGPSRILDWETGRREALLAALESVLNRPGWKAVVSDGGPGENRNPEPGPVPESDSAAVERRWRADWIRRTARRPFRRVTGPKEPLRFECTELDPGDRGGTETRILLDGRPLVPEVFDRGPAHSPAHLLDSGLLRATDEPREVQLAEAYCTEGCCGALYVTIRRDGDHVVWSDWRTSLSWTSSELPEYRFDAAAYDAEVARAENDHAWASPAHRTARLIAAGLRDRPELLTRWDARLHWISSDFRDRDCTDVSLLYRTEPGSGQGPATGQAREEDSWQQRMWHIPDDGTSPEERAAAALRRLATEDPRTYG